MFDFGAVFVIVVFAVMVTRRVVKHGWGSFIDYDAVKPKQHYEPKHYHDSNIDQVMSSKFPESLKDERKNA